jgi:hypothetical protein
MCAFIGLVWDGDQVNMRIHLDFRAVNMRIHCLGPASAVR